MNLLSTIAIIATLLTTWLIAALALHGITPDQQEVDEATSPAKHLWLKFLHIFNIEEAPLWWRALLKILLSLSLITAIVCGFSCTLPELNAENPLFWNIVLTLILEAISLGTIGFIGYAILMPREVLSHDYFGLYSTEFSHKKSYKQVKTTVIILNCFILCLAIALFVALYTIEICVFTSIGLVAFITFFGCIALAIVGIAIFKVLAGIFYVIYSYIKWLIK